MHQGNTLEKCVDNVNPPNVSVQPWKQFSTQWPATTKTKKQLLEVNAYEQKVVGLNPLKGLIDLWENASGGVTLCVDFQRALRQDSSANISFTYQASIGDRDGSGPSTSHLSPTTFAVNIYRQCCQGCQGYSVKMSASGFPTAPHFGVKEYLYCHIFKQYLNLFLDTALQRFLWVFAMPSIFFVSIHELR